VRAFFDATLGRNDDRSFEAIVRGVPEIRLEN
jgi:hypothetical protein